jgi:hypothetical protein
MTIRPAPMLLLAMVWALPAQDQDTNCPRYPQAARTELMETLELDRATQAYQRALRTRASQPRAEAMARANFIDELLFARLDADQVPPAPLSGDDEFARRIAIDLTGRTLDPERLKTFLLRDSRANKRQLLIDELLASPGYIDQWRLFLANRFEVTSGYYNYIGIQGRNLFHQFLRDAVARDRSLREVAAEMLTAGGDADQNGPANFMVRAWQDGDPIQDTWDTAADRVTTRLLGIKTECISCHDGRGHLEQINVHMARRRRQEFWGLSAFFARTQYQRLNVDSFGQRARFVLVDRKTGAYSTDVSITNPGPRPARFGGPYSPSYPFGNGGTAQSDSWREELARILTNDRQFARAQVNFVWAAMFTYGLVDPADGWDLARLDPRNPPAGWPSQLYHPELMERLTDFFIQSDYSLKSLVRLIANSNAYQLSSRYPEGQWRPAYTRYFAKHFPRRLAAEELWDVMGIATDTNAPMDVFGFTQPLLYANELPDPTEPRNNFYVQNFMNLFGRGNWWNIGRDKRPSLLQLLYTMNDSQVVLRSFAVRADAPPNRVARIAASSLSDEDAIREVFLATLSRRATDAEVATVVARRKGPRVDWLSDLQWALLNKLDFIFNY